MVLYTYTIIVSIGLGLSVCTLCFPLVWGMFYPWRDNRTSVPDLYSLQSNDVENPIVVSTTQC